MIWLKIDANAYHDRAPRRREEEENPQPAFYYRESKMKIIKFRMSCATMTDMECLAKILANFLFSLVSRSTTRTFFRLMQSPLFVSCERSGFFLFIFINAAS